MRTKFTNTEIVHIFANQTQEIGDASNLFFRGNKIYSYGYHYLLGEFVDAKTIVINDAHYSNSTSKHCTLLWRAIPEGIKIHWKSNVDLQRATNRIKKDFAALVASKTKGAYFKNQILFTWENLNEFIKYRKDKNTPKDIRYKEIKKIVKQVTQEGSNFTEMINKQKEAYKKRINTQIKKALQREQENLKRFINHEINYFTPHSNLTYLRIDKDGKEIETSKGVRIRKGEAILLYKKILENQPIEGGKISHYTINGIKGKNLVVGCHTIPMSEINRIGQTLIK